jgi:feruloyl esterase
VAQLTTLARSLAWHHCGRPADKASQVGSSNGGRHGMVAAARDTGAHDGILVSMPGFKLPLAAVAQVWGARQFVTVARTKRPDGVPDLASSFTPDELQRPADTILQRCNPLDGVRDGMVQDFAACQRASDPLRDVPICIEGPVAGTGCLVAQCRQVLAAVFKRSRPVRQHALGSGRARAQLAGLEVRQPHRPARCHRAGLRLHDAARPHGHAPFHRLQWQAAGGAFCRRPGVLVAGHSPLVRGVHAAARGGRPGQRAAVPGARHEPLVRRPATDQLDLVDARAARVEQGVAPDNAVAAARGAGSNLPNAEVQADWLSRHTRPLCAWPPVARYRGAGDVESADSVACSAP